MLSLKKLTEKVFDKILKEKLELKDWNSYVGLVADTYEKLPDFDNSVSKHWTVLNQSNYKLFQRLLSKVNLIFTTNEKSNVGSININGKDYNIEYTRQQDEYQTASEMRNKFKETGILKISIDYSEHPIFSVTDNIVFRTVHDYMAHILGGHDFGAKGEIASYNTHVKLAPNDAIPALFTEVVGQACYTIKNKNFPKQKIAVMDGFDFINLGKIDNEDYIIKDKVLVKKGEEGNIDKIINKSDGEAKAIFQPK
jgi:hypothetical protein